MANPIMTEAVNRKPEMRMPNIQECFAVPPITSVRAPSGDPIYFNRPFDHSASGYYPTISAHRPRKLLGESLKLLSRVKKKIIRMFQ